MNLGLKDQFVPYVLDGSKTHTIRAGERWKVGMRADLFARPRQKGMRLLFRAPVVKVQEIEISMWVVETGPLAGKRLEPRIEIDGALLTHDESDLFAWRDGFRHPMSAKHGTGYGSFHLMMDFWRRTTHNLLEKPFHGQIIHWNYEQRFMDIPKKAKQRYCESMLCSHYGEPVGRRHSCAP